MCTSAELKNYPVFQAVSYTHLRQSFIVLALAISPKYLFLDEAFDGLDPVMRLTFKRAISKMIEEKEMTVIISSHNPVSYTHLDVYKRQIYYFVFKFMILKFNYATPGREAVDEDTKLLTKDEYKALKDEKQSFGSDRFDVKGIIAALGGGDNILEISNCATRLRLLVKDEKAVQSLEEFKKYGAISLVKNGTSCLLYTSRCV